MRNVTDVGLAVEGQSMVLTKRKKRDRAFDHLAEMTIWLAPALGVKDFQNFGISLITFCRIEERLDEASGRVFCGGRVQIQSKCRKDFRGIAFKPVHLFIGNLTRV